MGWRGLKAKSHRSWKRTSQWSRVTPTHVVFRSVTWFRVENRSDFWVRFTHLQALPSRSITYDNEHLVKWKTPVNSVVFFAQSWCEIATWTMCGVLSALLYFRFNTSTAPYHRKPLKPVEFFWHVWKYFFNFYLQGKEIFFIINFHAKVPRTKSFEALRMKIPFLPSSQ